MFTKYNELVQDWRDIQKTMRDELDACGFVAVFKKCQEANDFSEIKILMKDMEDSPAKGYVGLRIKQIERGDNEN